MIIGATKESLPGERRVAATPQSVKKLINLGYEVVVESGCGIEANFPDAQYEQSGAQVLGTRSEVLTKSDIVLKVNRPAADEIESLKSGSTLVSFFQPSENPSELELVSSKKINTLAMDCVPRISRAQKLDALSSMANIAGYRAVIEAANEFGSFFTGQITAAGKVPPAKVLVIGAGVAGLAAIGTAKSLGAIVRAFDTRLAVKDQVKSMGADFLELEFEESGEGEGGYAKTMSDEFIAAEMALFADQAKEVDIIITTALIPGRPAPKLVTREMVKSMKTGSVIVDLAAQNGGNCEMTQPHQKVVTHDVTIIGYTDLPSRLPKQASNLYANNIVNLLTDMTPEKNGELVFDMEDQVVRGTTVSYQGETTWPPPKIVDPSPPARAAETGTKIESTKEVVEQTKSGFGHLVWSSVVIVLGLVLLGLIGKFAPPEFVSHLTVFALACFVGWQLVWNVTP
ncbi:MAG: Re/Si-specific NAD(P)(+) transhydrogenase subunit alpha, partial [Mariniblastus sp.]|nr:Re/Si-specific NAD(P)(+) transhydrogenase subunit alpha [Mariniblastus sp.]